MERMTPSGDVLTREAPADAKTTEDRRAQAAQEFAAPERAIAPSHPVYTAARPSPPPIMTPGGMPPYGSAPPAYGPPP